MTGLNPSILITDDDLEFRETLGGIFAPLGFRTLLAGDGEEALDIVRNDEVHLLLLDNNMPKLTGLETVRRIRGLADRLPCILLSARMDDVLREQARLAQVFSVLSKPVTRLQITDAVSQALKQTYGWE
jgi:CheY-like chemotaxis protein